MVDDIGVDTPHFMPKRFLAFVDACRKAGICLPTQRIEISEWNQAGHYPIGHKWRKRYWAGHDSKACVYWFTKGEDEGALTFGTGLPAPEVSVPTTDKCPVCLDYIESVRKQAGLPSPIEGV